MNQFAALLGRLVYWLSIAITAMMPALAPQVAAARPFWLSEPGFCAADHAVIEEADVVYLTEDGINSHWFGCTWSSETGLALLEGKQYVETRADCANATTTWTAGFEIVRQPDGALRVHQDSGGITPVTFYHCKSH